MVISCQNLDQKRSQLIAEYQTLSPLKRLILQLFSVIYHPVSRTDVKNCLRALGIHDKNNNSFTAKTLKPEIDELIKLGLLLQDKGKSPQCNPLIAEVATRDAIKQGNFERFVSVSSQKLRQKTGIQLYYQQLPCLLRHFRLYIYRQEIEKFWEDYDDFYRYRGGEAKIFWREIFLQICNNPFDAEWLSSQPVKLYEDTMSVILDKAKEKLIPAEEAFNLLYQQCINGGIYNSGYLRSILVEQLLLRGRFEELLQDYSKIYPEIEGVNNLGFLGWYLFVIDDNEKAIAFYTQALENLQKATRKKKIYFTSTAGIFFILALIKEGSTESLEQAQDYITIALKEKDFSLNYTYRVLERVIKMQRGDIEEKGILMGTNLFPLAEESYNSLDKLFRCLGFYWADRKKAKKSLPRILEPLYQDAKIAGFDWIALETGDLLVKINSNHQIKLEVEQLSQKLRIKTLANLIQPQEEWF